jgi:tRNA pseudouridine55 synthase
VNGVLVVDKPAGITSHDAVAAVRKRLGERRAGHAGTLDPAATGVLVIGLGRATRLLRFIEVHDKTYRADVVLGEETTTDDADGDVVAKTDASHIGVEDVEDALRRFVGSQEQIPPSVSAVKVGGERLYRKARRGEVASAPARDVVIHEIAMKGFTEGKRAGLTIVLRVSKGTYVRSIARDLGRALGVGGHVGALRRLSVGQFDEAAAVPLDRVGPDLVLPMEEAVRTYPSRVVDADGARALVHGRTLPASGIAGPYSVIGPEGLVAMAQDGDGEARSICVVVG